MAYSNPVVFVETAIFTRRIADCMNDSEYGALQAFLTERPEAGKVIRGSGGMSRQARRIKDNLFLVGVAGSDFDADGVS